MFHGQSLCKPGNEVASFPGVPHLCCSVYVKYNTRKRKICVFHRSSTSVYYTESTPKKQKWEGPGKGMRLDQAPLLGRSLEMWLIRIPIFKLIVTLWLYITPCMYCNEVNTTHLTVNMIWHPRPLWACLSVIWQKICKVRFPTFTTKKHLLEAFAN